MGREGREGDRMGGERREEKGKEATGKGE